MNPQSQESPPSFNLPLPGAEQGVQSGEQDGGAVHEKTTAKALEQTPAATPSPQPVNDAALTKMMGPPPMDPTVGLSPSQAMAASAMPQIADDTDLIEKEWVEKAKEIVFQTSQDPHLQNKEMNKVKVEYLKKRYNKDLKLGE